VQLAEHLVRELGVRDRRLAQKTANLAFAVSIFFSSSGSILVSTRLTKQLATLCTRLTSLPLARSWSSPARNASTTLT
jgi:hypothetical protein